MTPDIHTDTRIRPADKWRPDGSGSHYVRERWGKKRRAQRDPRIISLLLNRYGIESGRVLDAACGTGRLREAVRTDLRQWIGLDASASMLSEAALIGPGSCLQGELERLPFPDATFSAVVANRVIHHFHSQAELTLILGELLRVSAGPLIFSYWNSASLPEWRRRVGLSKREGKSGRVAHSTSLLRTISATLDAELLETRHVLPFLSQQSFAVLRRRVR
ncbi:MAG: SAM-dependent methyltransferase [Planctomycetota bacterium]|jgi:SAM-dependent methyltransferase